MSNFCLAILRSCAYQDLLEGVKFILLREAEILHQGQDQSIPLLVCLV